VLFFLYDEIPGGKNKHVHRHKQYKIILMKSIKTNMKKQHEKHGKY